MIRQAVILDPAHGKDVAGKRSPDGKHLEYIWSRQRIAKIAHNIISNKNIKFNLCFPFLYDEKEHGLTERVEKYNLIAKAHDRTFMLSLHNDAFGNDWSDPHGVGIWTSKGQDRSDLLATDLFKFLKSKYPNEKFRSSYYEDGDPDYEANFTVLAGNSKVNPNYDAILLEWLFQTNKSDVEKLQNKAHNEYLEDMLTLWLIKTFNV